MSEVAWFSSPPEAKLVWRKRPALGYLHFFGPKGDRAAIPVTAGPTYDLASSDPDRRSPVWHIEVNGDVATVSPSVHYIGEWHSPNPVQFRLVDELAGDH